MFWDTTSLEKEVKLLLLADRAELTTKQTAVLGAPLQIVASRKTLLTTTKVFRLINQIAVKNFEYKTVEEIESVGEVPVTDAVDKTGTQIGVIGQELQEVRSRQVTTRESGTMAVNSDEITWHLVSTSKNCLQRMRH